MELGDYVVKYRKEAGMTIDELASRSGVPKGTINKIIAGTTKSPTLENVRSLATALGKTLNDFVDTTASIEKAPSVSDEAAELAAANSGRKSEETLSKLLEPLCSNDEIQMLNDYRSLSKQGKEYMRQTMEMAKGTYKKDCASSYMGVG